MEYPVAYEETTNCVWPFTDSIPCQLHTSAANTRLNDAHVCWTFHRNWSINIRNINTQHFNSNDPTYDIKNFIALELLAGWQEGCKFKKSCRKNSQKFNFVNHWLLLS